MVRPAPRKIRVAEEIRKIVSNLVLNELKDPRMGFVTITRVEVTDNMRFGKIYYSVLGSEAERKGTAAALKRSLGFIKRTIKTELPIKIIPEITFKFDPSIEHGIELDVLINKIHKEKPVSTDSEE